MPPTLTLKSRYDREWTLLNNRWFTTKNEEVFKLADDTDIPEITDNTEWVEATEPAYSWYNNTTDEEVRAKYGPLYNGYCIQSGLKRPANASHVTHTNWTDLYDWMIANGYNWDHDPPTTESLTVNKIGKALSSSGGEWAANATAGNVGNDQDSNNSSGMNFLPGGVRDITTGEFLFFAERANYFSTGTNLHRLQYLSPDPRVSSFASWLTAGCSARLTAIARKVTFSTDGGSAVNDAFWFDQDTIEAPVNPTKAGFAFAGWYKEDTLTAEWDFSTDTVTADITLYAKWNKKSRVFLYSKLIYQGL